MSDKLKRSIVWLDDSQERIDQLRSLKRSLSSDNFSLEGIHCSFKGISAAISQIKKLSPRLIIVDQFLNTSPNNLPQKGTEWAQILREEIVGVALVGTTAHDGFKPNAIQEFLFIDWFDANKLIRLENSHELVAIANGFHLLWSSQKNRKNWLGFLNPPKSQLGLLEASAPIELASNQYHSIPHIFSRWIWNNLLKWPGFTYDSLEIATLLGLNEKGLQKIQPALKPFVYDGVFSSQKRTRWWVNETCEFIRSQTEDGYSYSMQETGRAFAKKYKCTKRHYSVNYNSDKVSQIPDCVAYGSDSPTEQNRVQIDIESTTVIGSRRPLLGFEDLRMIKTN